MNQRVLEALSIAMITAGIGILTYLLPFDLSRSQILLGLCVLFILVVTIAKVYPSSGLSRRRLALLHAGFATKREGKGSVSQHELQRYFAWVEKKLARLIELEELQCGLAGIKRGPLVITLRLRLINPNRKDLHKLLQLGPALAQMLQVEAVRIADTAQGVLVEIPSPKPLTPNGALLARHTRGLRIAVGVDTFAKPLHINLKDHGAVFWVGPSRRGKTQSMKSCLYALIADGQGQIHFVIIASPAKVQQDWGVYASVVGCLGIASTKSAIAAATAWVVAHMNSQNTTPLILIIDDLPSILKAVPSISEDLIDIAGMGAGLGIHFWAGTQGAGSKRTSGGTEIENNVTARIIYRPSTARTGSQSAGTGGLELHQLSSAKGDALALIDGTATRIATAWISDRDIALLPSGQGAQAPWLNQSSTSQNHPEPPAKPARTTVEPGKNQIEPSRTTQNQVESVIQRPQTPPTLGADGHNDSNTLEPVLEPAIKPGSADQYVSYLATLTNDQLKTENLGFDGSRFPTPDEQRSIMAAYNISGSLNKACFICYGYKNPKIVSYVKPVVQSIGREMEETSDSSTDTQELPEVIDLNTLEGQSLFAELKREGAIKLPNPDTLKDERRLR